MIYLMIFPDTPDPKRRRMTEAPSDSKKITDMNLDIFTRHCLTYLHIQDICNLIKTNKEMQKMVFEALSKLKPEKTEYKKTLSFVIQVYSHVHKIFVPQTRIELKMAVDEWCECEETAYKKYQHISTWDVSQVTNMKICLMEWKALLLIIHSV